MLSVCVSLAWFICSNARSCGGVLDPPYSITFRESGPNKCGWQIRGKAAFMRVTFTLVDMAFEPDCRWNYIAIYDGDRENSTELKRLCGYHASPVSFYSTTGRMHILLGTQNTTENQRFTAGFTSLDRISRGNACGGDKIDVHCETGTVCVNSTNDACPLDSSTCTCKLARTLDQHCGSTRGSPPRPCATGTICLANSTRCSNNDTVTGCFCRGDCHLFGCLDGRECSNVTNRCESKPCKNDDGNICGHGSTCLNAANEYCTHASTCTCFPDIAKDKNCGGGDGLASHICKDPLFCLTSTNAFCPHGAASTECTCKRLACHDITDGDICASHIEEDKYNDRSRCIWCCGDFCPNSWRRTNKKCVPWPAYREFREWTTPGKHRGHLANCLGVYSAGNCGGNNTQSCVSGTVCLTATNAVCQRDVPTEDCTCKPLVDSGDNCGGGPGHYSQFCATGYVCWAQEKKCPQNASVEACTCKPACTRPETFTGYNLDYVKEDLARGSFNVSNVTCAPGYSGNATALKCKSAGDHYALDGCDIRMCTRPGTLTGYNPEYAKEDLDEGSFRVTNLTCAPGYSGNAKAQKCNSIGEHYTLNGCTLGPRCQEIQDERICNQMRSENGEPCVWFCGRSSRYNHKCLTLNMARGYKFYNNGICPTCTNDTYANGTGIIAGTGDCSWSLEGAANEVIRLFITKFDCPRSYSSNDYVALYDGNFDRNIVPMAKNFRVVYSSEAPRMSVKLNLPLWTSGCNFSATFTKTSVVDADGACHGTGDGPLPCVEGTTCATSANQLCAWKVDPTAHCTCKYPVPSKSYCGGGTDRVSSFCEVGNKCETSDGQACPFGFDVDKCLCQPGCGGVVEGRSGSFSSYQGVYKNEGKVDCNWRIQGNAPDLIRLTFHHSTMRDRSSCWNDYVQVSEGTKWCGKDLDARTFFVPSPANVKLVVDNEKESIGSGFSLDFSVIALNETAEYSEIKRFGECNSTNQLLAVAVSLKNCADICHVTSGCQHFIFNAKNRECYQEDTRTSSCSEGWQASEFNFYMLGRQAVTVQAAYKKLHENSICGSNSHHQSLATNVTLQECANLCQLTFLCKYFIFQRRVERGSCYKENTQSAACAEKWLTSKNYDFHELQETEPAVVVTSTVAPKTSTTEATTEATEATEVTTEATTETTEATEATTEATEAATVDTTIDPANTSDTNIVTGAEGYGDMTVIIVPVVAVLFVSVYTISQCRHRNAAEDIPCEEI